jgi:hypothetical protein
VKTLFLVSLALAVLSGCSGIGSISGSAGYTSPTTGIVYGLNYTKTFADGKTARPIKQ